VTTPKTARTPNPPPANEELISLEAVRKLAPLRHSGRGGGPPSLESLIRACRDGVRAEDGQRVRLESVRLSGRRMTTAAAVERWVSRLAAKSPAPLREADAARLAHRRAEAELAAAGI
jgi:hypothetical protein